MSKKVVIVGGVAGGASAAARLRRLDEEAEIVILERGDHISFANCGLPYYIGGVIPERESLLVQTPESMEARFDLEVRIRNEAVAINRKDRCVEVKDLLKNRTYSESYDYLILSPGAEPIRPPVPGIDAPGVFTLRNIPDTDEIKDFIDNNKPQKAVVVGGGFIGLEMAENLQEQGIDVTLVEMVPQVMNQIDLEMASMIHNHLRAQGVKLCLNDGITGIQEQDPGLEVGLQSGNKIEADMILLATGVRPNSELAEECGLEIGETGGIKVNEYLQTSDENIYAIGDVIEVEEFVTGAGALIPMAGPANKQGRIAANNICGRKEKYRGTQGTYIAKVFELAAAATGAAEKNLQQAGVEYLRTYTISNNHAGYYPGAVPMTVKILYTPTEGKLLGAQIVGREGVDKRIDVLAAAIRNGLTIFDLQELELAYAPPFGSAKDPVNMAGYTAGNLLNGLMDVICWDQVDEYRQRKDVIFLDVREKEEVELGKIKDARHIPLNSLRGRLDELPQDKELIVYCAVGLRGYIACRILMQHGFERVKNLSGGFRLYKAVQDDRKQVIERPDRDIIDSATTPEEGKIIE